MAVTAITSPPFTSSMIDGNGRCTRAWYDWFNYIYAAAGGGPNPSPTAEDSIVLMFDVVSGNEAQSPDGDIEFAKILALQAQATASSVQVNGVPGVNGSLFFNNEGEVDGTTSVIYDASTGAITFVNPTGIIQALSSLVIDAATYVEFKTNNISRLKINQDGTWSVNSSIGVAKQAIVSGGVGVSPQWEDIVNSNIAGSGISVSSATGNVTVTNTGVLSVVAGTNITVSGPTGNVTVNAVPSGADTQLQFNNTGVFDASSKLTYVPNELDLGDGTFDGLTKLKFNADGGDFGWLAIAGSDEPYPGSMYFVAPKGLWLDGDGLGTSGQVLTSNGAAQPTWEDASTGGVTSIELTSVDGSVVIAPTGPQTGVVSIDLSANLGEGQTPFYIPPGETFTVEANKQVLYKESISLGAGATLNVIGHLLSTLPPLTPTSASGSNTQVQFNDSGVLGANSGFVYDKTNGNLSTSFGGATVLLDPNFGGSQTLFSTPTPNMRFSRISPDNPGGSLGAIEFQATNTADATTSAGGVVVGAGSNPTSGGFGAQFAADGGSSTGVGGGLFFKGGDSTSNRGGTIVLRGGNGSTFDGSILFEAGHGSSGGVILFHTSNTNRLLINDNGEWDIATVGPGTSGQVITSQGSGTDPTWTEPTVTDHIQSAETLTIPVNRQYIVYRSLVNTGIIINLGTIVVL